MSEEIECEYCKKGEGKSILYDEEYDALNVFIKNGLLWEKTNDMGVEINYCPICGRKLGEQMTKEKRAIEEMEKVKINIPIFNNIEEAELENKLNFHLEEFTNEIMKTISKDKDIIILKKVIEKQQKEIEKNQKFKEDVVNLIMIWDKKELPENDSAIETLKTIMSEVSRLEDIEDRKIQVEVKFVEEKRDKYWKDKIREKIEELEHKDFIAMQVVMKHDKEALKIVDVLKELLEEE